MRPLPGPPSAVRPHAAQHCRRPRGSAGWIALPFHPQRHSRESGNLSFHHTPQHHEHPRLAQLTSIQAAQYLDRLSLCLLHSWHVARCIADQKVKIYIRSCRCDAAPYLLPRTRDARHRVLTVSSSLGQGPPGLAQILLPCVRAILCDLASALCIQAPTSVGASFFGRLQICMADLPIARLCLGKPR